MFVDDNPMELAEVKDRFPEIECLRYPTQNDALVYELLARLCDLFGRDTVTEEDQIRLAKLRKQPKAAERDDDGETLDRWTRSWRKRKRS